MNLLSKKTFLFFLLLLIPGKTLPENAYMRLIKKLHKQIAKNNAQRAQQLRYALTTYCAWLALPWLKQYLSFDETVNILGHDPHISRIPSATETNKIPVITSMGLPDPEGMYSEKFNTNNTFTVTCRFHDTSLRDGSLNPLVYFNALRAMSIGQESDAKTLLFTVIRCYKQGHKKINIFANSRGGAVVVKMLDMLSNPENYEDIWENFEINDTITQEETRTIVAAGKTYLAHPLMNYKLTIKCRLATALAPLGHTITKFLSRFGYFGELTANGLEWTVFPATKYTIYHAVQKTLQLATDYNPNSTNPIQILTNNIGKKSWPYHITIALAKKDEVVGHAHETILAMISSHFTNKLTIEPGGKHHRDIRELVKKFRETLTTVSTTHNIDK